MWVKALPLRSATDVVAFNIFQRAWHSSSRNFHTVNHISFTLLQRRVHVVKRILDAAALAAVSMYDPMTLACGAAKSQMWAGALASLRKRRSTGRKAWR